MSCQGPGASQAEQGGAPGDPLTSEFPKYLWAAHKSVQGTGGWGGHEKTLASDLQRYGGSPGAGQGPCREGVSTGLSELESALIQLKSFYKHHEAFTDSRD